MEQRESGSGRRGNDPESGRNGFGRVDMAPKSGGEGMRGGKAMLIPSSEAFEQKFMIFQVVK